MIAEKYSTQQRDDVVAYVRQIISTSNSQNEAATRLGISPGHIGHLRDGNWEQISEKLFLTLSAQISTWRDAMTEGFALATGIFTEAQKHSRMLGLEGDTGMGKTHAARLYTRRSPRSYLVTGAPRRLMGERAFLAEINRAIGVRPEAMGISGASMLDAIVRKLVSEERPLLIIDDAHQLCDDNMRLLKVLFDRVERSAGIVLAGTSRLTDDLDRKARRDALGFREFRRRIAWWERMPLLSAEDVASVCTANYVTDPGAVRWFQKNTSNLGTLNLLVEQAKTYAQTQNLPLNRELLAAITAGKNFVFA